MPFHHHYHHHHLPSSSSIIIIIIFFFFPSSCFFFIFILVLLLLLVLIGVFFFFFFFFLLHTCHFLPVSSITFHLQKKSLMNPMPPPLDQVIEGKQGKKVTRYLYIFCWHPFFPPFLSAFRVIFVEVILGGSHFLCCKVIAS